MNNTITAIPGLKVGHWTNLEAGTGCTVLLCPSGMTAGVDVRGTSPGTRETDLLDPVCKIEQVHALVLSGGSAYGLATADGVMRWLEEQGYGYDVGIAKVPIVPTAILFDLGFQRADVRPDAAAGYAACQTASEAAVTQGNIGAGTGATVGKFLGFDRATKGGLGSVSRAIGEGVIVGAMVAVNPVGNVVDPSLQQTIAGARLPDDQFADPLTALPQMLVSRTNTTIGIVATNAKLTKSEATKMAQMAHDGLARTIYPAHTDFDGDAIFALSHGGQSADVTVLGMHAAAVTAEAIVAAVMAADSLGGLPSARSL